MKIQNILRMQAVAIGFAGVLFLASSAPAQEIENKVWPDSPGTTTFVQAASASPDNLNTTAANSGSMAATATVAKPIATQKAAFSQWPAVQTWMTASLLAFFAMLALYKRKAARRANQGLESRVRQVDDRVALS
jgi:hypothetical protein